MKTLKIALAAFSVFASLTLPVFADPHAFPVPFVGKEHSTITFTDLPGPGNITISTIDGDEVASLTVAAGELTKQWSVTNNSGKKVASGVYLYRIEPHNTVGKLVVIR